MNLALVFIGFAMASLTIDDDGQSGWLQLRDGENKIVVTCADWNGSSLALRSSHDGDDANATKVRATVGGDEVIATENDEYIYTGPGYFGGVMSSYGSTPVVMTAYPIRQPVSS